MTIWCIHPLLAESGGQTNLSAVLRFLPKLMACYVTAYLAALLPLCYQSYSNSGTDIYFFLSLPVTPAEQVLSRK